MIEREFVAQKIKEFEIEEYIRENLKRVGHSHTKVQRTPLGEKIIIHVSKPGLVVGRKGENIKNLTTILKKKFKLENPQIEISEVMDVNLDPQIVAERIANSLERYGTSRFKGVGHKTMEDAIRSGARGIEIIISGKIPSSRAKNWRFYQGYLKKCGDIAVHGVRKAITVAQLKTGVIGIKVSIMPPDVRLPDDIKLLSELQTEETKGKEEDKEIKKEVKKSESSDVKKENIEKKNKAKKATKDVKNEDKGN